MGELWHQTCNKNQNKFFAALEGRAEFQKSVRVCAALLSSFWKSVWNLVFELRARFAHSQSDPCQKTGRVCAALILERCLESCGCYFCCCRYSKNKGRNFQLMSVDFCKNIAREARGAPHLSFLQNSIDKNEDLRPGTRRT